MGRVIPHASQIEIAIAAFDSAVRADDGERSVAGAGPCRTPS